MMPPSFWDGGPAEKVDPNEPPPPASEDDYGQNVVPIKGRGKLAKRQPEGWKAEWHMSDNGTPLPNLFNVMLALRHHPRLAGIVRYDEMARTAILSGQVPNTPHDASIPRCLKDADIIAIQEEIQLTGLRRVSKGTIQDGVDLRANQSRYHPVKDYLSGLTWDGVTRVRGWLSRYLGVEGGDYSDTIGQLFLIALIARVFEPGCKADYMLILEGPQGALKSTACRVLAGEWFSDNLPDLSRGDAVRLSMHLRGKWLIEIAEMSSFNAAESHTLKEFLTQTEERYTPKYGRNEVNEPRQCLFIGSTNEGAYLRDATGARRFWPVRVGEIKIDDLRADRDQLLAEAVALFRNKQPWWPSREFEADHIAPQQAERYEADAWEELIVNWLDGGQVFASDGQPVFDERGDHVRNTSINKCTITQVALGPLNLPIGMVSTPVQRRISAILTRLEWKQGRTNKERFFTRPQLDKGDGV